MTEDSAANCVCDCPAPGGHRRTRGLNESLSCGGYRKSEEENDYWKRHRDPGHGESPFSGLGLTWSGSFFLPQDTKNLLQRILFLFAGLRRRIGRALAGRIGGRLGSYGATGLPFASVWGVLGSPPKTRERMEPVVVKRLWPPWTSQYTVGAEPAT